MSYAELLKKKKKKEKQGKPQKVYGFYNKRNINRIFFFGINYVDENP